MGALDRAATLVDRRHLRNGRPFDLNIPTGPPTGGRTSWVHYGVMVPNLPAPHHTFGAMGIVGTPGLAIFGNDALLPTGLDDAATMVSATGAITDAMTGGAFGAYSANRDCEFAADGSLVRFGDDVVFEGRLPQVRVRRHHPEAEVDLRLQATDSVTWFANWAGGLYEHWSVLCTYEGTIGDLTTSGLCTYEYAHGINVRLGPLRLPSSFFCYHVLNITEDTQLLLSVMRSAFGIPIITSAFTRSLHDLGREYTDVDFEVVSAGPPRATPDGRNMTLPEQLRWTVRRDDGSVLAQIDGAAHDDWAYGLGAGFVGSYRYTGSFEDRDVEGTAYLEYVDLR